MTTINQNVTVQTNPLYLDSTQANTLTLFFEAMGIASTDISFTPAVDESAIDDSSTLYTVVYQFNCQLLDGTRYGFAKQFTLAVLDGDISSFKRRFKYVRDEFVNYIQSVIITWLGEDMDSYAAGTFTPPSGMTLDQYVRAILADAQQLPSIVV
jgi:hypothetical protein